MTVARATGWDENKIIWEIPMVRLLQYVHAEWCFNDTPCTWEHFAAYSNPLEKTLEMATEKWEESKKRLSTF